VQIWTKGYFKREFLNRVILVTAIVSIFFPIIANKIYDHRIDYGDHIRFALEMAQYKEIRLPHFLWHVFVIAVQKLVFPSPETAAVIVTLASCVFLGLIIHRSLGGLFGTVFGIELGSIGLTLALLIVTPILLLVVLDAHVYLGYIGITTYHNPTIILLRPIALLHFGYVVHVFDNQPISKRTLALTAILTILSTLTKPSYTICLLPSLAILAAYKCVTKQRLGWKFLLVGIIVPSLVVLLWQYAFTYGSLGEQDVFFAPFDVMASWSGYLLPKFMLSAMFPLCVLVFYFKEVIKDNRLVLAWIMFLCGAFYTYFLAESGSRGIHGNFWWSGQISLFILFWISTLFVVKKKIVARGFHGVDLYLLAFVFSCHVISGILFYAVDFRFGFSAW